jgi:hypothetical protein
MTILKMSTRNIFIDPSYTSFYLDKLFDLSDPVLNRDNQLLPTARLRDAAKKRGYSVATADRLFEPGAQTASAEYYSMGLTPDYEKLRTSGVRLRGYILYEPPVVAPKLYDNLPTVAAHFERVYVHNTHGDGYSLTGVKTDALRKLYWPLPYRGVIESHWGRRERAKRIVVINSHHRPLSKDADELYSKRIEAIATFVKQDAVDLYGYGWNRWLTRCNLWLPYLLHRRALLGVYRGPCRSKYETLSGYTHCLCLENMRMDGYVTEKIFDCLYSGTIPLYLGAADIAQYVPADAFVDCRKFTGWDEVLDHARSMSAAQIGAMREAGRAFLESDRALPFYHSLEDIMLGTRS